jgi:hypothetical protein
MLYIFLKVTGEKEEKKTGLACLETHQKPAKPARDTYVVSKVGRFGRFLRGGWADNRTQSEE